MSEVTLDKSLNNIPRSPEGEKRISFSSCLFSWSLYDSFMIPGVGEWESDASSRVRDLKLGRD